MKIAVVILNWNGKTLLEQFLPSVIQHSKEADIYLADNASTDDSVSFISTHFPRVQIIRNSENGGFAKGYNDALEHVEADAFCLLNSDVEVSENWLYPIIETFNNDSKIAIIQPKLLDYKHKDHFEYAGAAGGFIDKYGYPYCRGRIFNTIEKDEGQYDDSSDIFWASGACLFIRKNVYQALHGFDELFFAHMEEIDLCWRAKNLGYSIKYVSSSIVYHVGGATLSNTSPKKTFLNFRNSLFTLTKNVKGNLFMLIFSRLILDCIAGIKFILNFKPLHTFAIIKAHFSYYQHLHRLLNKRKLLNNSTIHYNKKCIVWLYYVQNKKQYNSL